MRLPGDAQSGVAQLFGKNALITGGLGLIGSALALRLVEIGASVLIVDSLNDHCGGNLFNISEISERVRVHICDVRNPESLRELIDGQDVIFNLAGQSSHMGSMQSPFEDLEINCTAQLSLLELCRALNPTVQIVYASTRQVYGRPEYLPVDEAHPLRPVDVNGINKISGESFHLLYSAVYGVDSTVLRLTNTYGPHMRIRDGQQMFMGSWIRKLLDGEPIEVWGGSQSRDFLFVDDAAEAFIVAAVTPETIGKIYNVGGAERATLLEVAELMIQEYGSGTMSKMPFPVSRQRIDIGDYYTDDSAFRSLTGWAPRVDLSAGIARTLSFYRTNARHYS